MRTAPWPRCAATVPGCSGGILLDRGLAVLDGLRIATRAGVVELAGPGAGEPDRLDQRHARPRGLGRRRADRRGPGAEWPTRGHRRQHAQPARRGLRRCQRTRRPRPELSAVGHAAAARRPERRIHRQGRPDAAPAGVRTRRRRDEIVRHRNRRRGGRSVRGRLSRRCPRWPVADGWRRASLAGGGARRNAAAPAGYRTAMSCCPGPRSSSVSIAIDAGWWAAAHAHWGRWWSVDHSWVDIAWRQQGPHLGRWRR